MEFWNKLAQTRSRSAQGIAGSATRSKLAKDYLRLLEGRAVTRSRVIDKTPINSDYLGHIYSVFPNARFIYMDRDPIGCVPVLLFSGVRGRPEFFDGSGRHSALLQWAP